MPRTIEDFFSALPSAAAVCLIELQDENAEPLLIRTQNLRRSAATAAWARRIPPAND